MADKKILIVEDDPSLGETLLERLQQEYEVRWARNCQQARSLLSETPFDLIILDVGLPDGSGFDLAKEIRSRTKTLFIFLTAQADAESRLHGFELGAEEFIPKPFQLKELLIRAKHVLDLHVPLKEIQLEECTLNFTDMTILFPNGKIEYPPVTDMKVLQYLVESSPRPVSRDDIINHVWGVDKMPSHRSIDNIVVRLRQLLGDSKEKYIRSVRGVGYQWGTTGSI